jgi:hypothetical protein
MARALKARSLSAQAVLGLFAVFSNSDDDLWFNSLIGVYKLSV